MSTSSPSELLSLPKGGGSLQPLGERFAPDLHTGTGNMTFPIELPPGRGGFQPRLALTYSTGHGNGPFGLGWTVGLPSIARRTSKGVPTYREGDDTFVLSGADELVPVESADGARRYRPRSEESFARIERVARPHGDFWIVESRAGVIDTYDVTVRHPRLAGAIFSWRLGTTRDPFGNRIEYVWDPSPVGGSEHQLYITEIRYGHHHALGEDRPAVIVRFEYEPRPDPFCERRAGFAVRTAARCRAIAIETWLDERRLARTYRLSYEPAPSNGVSLLRRVTVVGHDVERSESLPPVSFGYSVFAPETRRLRRIECPDLPPGLGATSNRELVDADGDGLPDIVELDGRIRWWRNRGDGTFDRPRTVDRAPAGVRLSDRGVQLLDADGDGRIDVMVSRGPLSGYFPLDVVGEGGPRSFRRWSAPPSFDLEDPEVRLVDLDGDGITDAIRSGTRLDGFFADPERGWRPGPAWRSDEPGPAVSFSDHRVRFADMTGDGLQDLVVVEDGRVDYWPSLGHGRWGERVRMSDPPRFGAGVHARQLLVGDVDGDGASDIVVVENRRVTLWLNRQRRIRQAPEEGRREEFELLLGEGGGRGGEPLGGGGPDGADCQGTA